MIWFTVILLLQQIDQLTEIKNKRKIKLKRSNSVVISVSPKSKSPMRSRAITLINRPLYCDSPARVVNPSPRLYRPSPITRSPNRSPTRRPFYQQKPKEPDEQDKLKEFF